MEFEYIFGHHLEPLKEKTEIRLSIVAVVARVIISHVTKDRCKNITLSIGIMFVNKAVLMMKI